MRQSIRFKGMKTNESSLCPFLRGSASTRILKRNTTRLMKKKTARRGRSVLIIDHTLPAVRAAAERMKLHQESADSTAVIVCIYGPPADPSAQGFLNSARGIWALSSPQNLRHSRSHPLKPLRRTYPPELLVTRQMSPPLPRHFQSRLPPIERQPFQKRSAALQGAE